jgi:two-component system cell cycle sensor histidine kinase/response regulator CckA
LGSTFKIYFPRVQTRSAEPETQAVSPQRAGTGTVLLVEDEGVVRDYTTRVLDRAGFAVIAAADAAEALRLVEDEGRRIDVLVTDVVMPGMSGPDLAERIMERFPSVGVVLLSGYTAETLNLEAVLEHGARFVTKPFTSAVLIAAVNEARAAARSRS